MNKCLAIDWYTSNRNQVGAKFITGMRGTGKTECLKKINQLLKSEGVPEKRRLWLDAADSWIRQYPTSELLAKRIKSRLPSGGKNYLFIREAASLPDADTLLGVLFAQRNLEIIATSSSQRLLERGLKRYLNPKIQHLELLPSLEASDYSPDFARALWNEIFISDVLEPNIVLETGLLNRAVGWLSDHLGDPLSLRIISRAISPTQRELSPHTIERYLKTLEDSHLIEPTMVINADTGVISKRNYKYFFTDPKLRLAKFGPAPENESRRAAFNYAWLTLRHQTRCICCTIHNSEVDFVTFADNGDFRRWKVLDDGKLRELHT